MRAAGMAAMLASIALAVATPPPVLAQNTENSVRLLLRWVETKPDEGLRNYAVFLGFHNGEFDSFDLGQPANAFIAEWLPRGFGPSAAVIEAFERRYPGATGAWLWNPTGEGNANLALPPPRFASVSVDPRRHRFLSYLTPLAPTNDALAGNEDPFQIEVFDADGRFKGPLYVDVYGNQVVDAGICANDEARLTGLDVAPYDQQQCQPGEGVVDLHPGLNGSYRNPAGSPQRVLGGETTFYVRAIPTSSATTRSTQTSPGPATRSAAWSSRVTRRRATGPVPGTARTTPAKASTSRSSSRTRAIRARASSSTGTPTRRMAAASRSG
jgi:hypothetical protein